MFVIPLVVQAVVSLHVIRTKIGDIKMAYTPTPLTTAQKLTQNEPCRAQLWDMARAHPDFIERKNDHEAETTIFIFKDGSKLLFEPHSYEIF